MSKATELIGYLGGLVVTGGEHAGDLWRVLGWQSRFIKHVWGRADRGVSALSIGRGNGKSAVTAALAVAALDPRGPLHQPRGEVLVCASSFAQSNIIFRDALHFLGLHAGRVKGWKVANTINNATIEHRESGARLVAVAHNPRTLHGSRAQLALLDEPAQWPSSTSEKAYVALKTGMGKVPGSKLVALGTAPAETGGWFGRLIAGPDAIVYQAAADDDPLAVSTWRKANPSMDWLPALRKEIAAEAALVRRDSTMLPAFRSLRLNMGTADTEQSVLLDDGVWRAIEGDAPAIGKPVWGLDLGTSAAMSAVASFWPGSGRLECLAAFPEVPTLAERGLADGVGTLYEDCRSQGELIQAGGNATDVSALLAEARRRWGQPSLMAADRWRLAELRDAARSVLRPVTILARGMGFQDGAADVRAFRKGCLTGKVTPVPSVLLIAAMGAARVIRDPAGNEKLAKIAEGGRRMRARDDAAAASILAVAAGLSRPTTGRRLYRGRVA